MTARNRLRRWVFVVFATAIGGCAQTGNYIVLLDSEDGNSVGAVTVTNENGTRTLNSPRQSIGLEEGAGVAVKVLEEDDLQRDFAMALAAQPEKPLHFLLYFETGTTELTEASSTRITEMLAALDNFPVPNIGVIGHTDTAGTEEHNAGLAVQRAEAIRDVFIAAGAPAELIEVSSHGEENLLIKTADGVDEPRNRRVEVVIR